MENLYIIILTHFAQKDIEFCTKIYQELKIYFFKLL